MNNGITTQALWNSPIWWLGMIAGAVQVAFATCTAEGLGDPRISNVIVAVIGYILMVCNCNNPSIKGDFTLAAKKQFTPEQNEE